MNTAKFATVCGYAVVAFLAFSLICGLASAGAITIDFGPAFGASANQTVLTDQLKPYGVLFSTTSPNGVIWNGRSPFVGSYSFNFHAGFTPDGFVDTSPIRIEFVDPTTGAPTTASNVSVRGFDGGGDLDILTLNAFDATGALIASHTVGPHNFFGDDGFMGNTARIDQTGIAYVVIETSGVQSGLFFDDLSFELSVASVPVPVVLVHGIGGSPASFGDMPQFLTEAGLTVAPPFDYSMFTGRTSAVTIEELATFLGDHIVNTVLPAYPGASQVDVVAHSMGGLIARAWMASIAEPPGLVPYTGKVRRLILVGTPNYGAEAALLGRAERALRLPAVQIEEMKFGSSFILRLHDAWEEFLAQSSLKIPSENMLFIVGSEGNNLFFPCNACDGVVEMASAVLPLITSPVRYVPYRHGDFDGPPFIVTPRNSTSLIGVAPGDAQHKTLLLVRAFLTDGEVLPQCCGAGTVDHAPQGLERGLLLLRFQNAATGKPITERRIRLREPFSPAPPDYNNRNAGTVTVWNLDADLGPYAAEARVNGYCPRNIGEPVIAAQPRVAEIDLTMTNRRRDCRP